jgi:Fic family protein
MSYTPPFEITSKILNLVSEISEAIGKLEVLTLSSKNLKLRKANKIKTITGTLSIEGNTLSKEKVTAILNGKRVIAKEKEIAEVKGAIAVYDKLDDFDYKNLDDLLEAHKILMKDILINPGIFRTSDVAVGGESGVVHVAPPFSQVSSLMYDLFKWLKNSDIHPLIKGCVFHYEFEFIHPFVDGNGRMGRLWQTLILYKYKNIFAYIPIESVIKQKQEEYYKALEISNEEGKSTFFIEFMLEAILEACKNEMFLQNVPNDVPKNVPKEREEKIISLVKDNPHITIEQLSIKCNVSDKTIKRDIAKLKKEGVIKREGGAKNGVWIVLI